MIEVDGFERFTGIIKRPCVLLRRTALTERENEILVFLSNGFANKEIADKLNLRVPTVRTHLRHIYEKLHVRSRSEAIGNTCSKPAPQTTVSGYDKTSAAGSA
jgi:DNA-binding CsgD family transcriptional regulator